MIDLILANNTSKVLRSEVIDFSKADHRFIYIIQMLKIRNSKPAIRYVKNLKKVTEHPSEFKLDLENALKWVCNAFDDLDDITWVWHCMYK